MSPSRSVLALDIGGTKLAAAVLNASGEMLARDQVATPRNGNAEELYARVCQLAHGVLDAAEAGVVAIGVGCGGPMRYPEGEVSPLNIPAWRGFPLRARLSDMFGWPCRVDNDAKALSLGEHWRGGGQGSRNMLGMVASTGVGGGLIVDGRLLHGERGNAGHVGHVIAMPGGALCGCGARGCVEAIASGTGIARRWRESRRDPDEPTATWSAIEIAQAARAGDATARALFLDAGMALARGIAAAAALIDLERVVIGGSVALRAWDLIRPSLEAEIERCARLDFTRGLAVRRAALGDAAGLVGAAALALELADHGE